MSAETSFLKCLAAGKAGEKLLVSKYPHLRCNTRGEKKVADVISENGTLIEVKYCQSARARQGPDGNHLNMMVEIYKNWDGKSPGGPYRARLDGCKFYVQLFKKPFQCYIFDVELLCAKVQELRTARSISTYSCHSSFKRNLCYLVPMRLVKDCLVSESKFLQLTRNVRCRPGD